MKSQDLKVLLIKNYKYIIAGILFLVLVIVLVVTSFQDKAEVTGDASGNAETVTVGDSSTAGTSSTSESDNPFVKDGNEAVNTLISDYYKAYAEGDVTSLQSIAIPFSEEEQAEKVQLSQFIDSFESITCYTKVGPIENSYMVAVYLEIKFKDVKTTAPGLTTLYVCTKDDGTLYIDNRARTDLEPEVQTYAASFEKEADYLALEKQVSEKYTSALASDADLKKLLEETIPNLATASGDATTDTKDTTAETPTTDTKDTTDTETKDTTDAVATTDTTTEKKETVWASEPCKIRQEASETGAQIGSAYKGDYFVRVSDSNGWSKVEYNGGVGYIKTEFLTTTNPNSDDTSTTDTSSTTSTTTKVFHTEGQEITVSESTNIRSSMDESSKLMGTAAPGDTVTVVLDYAEGWTKVTWNGKTGYIRTDLLD